MSPPSRLPPDPVQRRYQLHFLIAALDHVLPIVQDVERAASELELPPWTTTAGGEAAGILPAAQLLRLRELATDTILSTGR